MHGLDKLVKEMLETHKGGEVFFDHLDEGIKNNVLVVDTLIDTIPNITEQNIILSGGFGEFFRDYLRLLKIKPKNVIWVNGGLRKGARAFLYDTYLDNKDFIFIDDSFYSGKTRNVIKEELEKYNARLVNTYVVYDGSHVKENTVHSLYRYYK